MFKEKYYRDLYEQQKKLTDKVIETATNATKLCKEQTKEITDYSKSLDDAIEHIKKLQEQNNRLVMEVAMLRSKMIQKND